MVKLRSSRPSQDNGPLPERAVAMLVYEILRVVRCCHAAGILHGDIKVMRRCSAMVPVLTLQAAAQSWKVARVPVYPHCEQHHDH